jgi:hypothetical protein
MADPVGIGEFQGEPAMTEQEWLTCTDPVKMLESLHGKARDRKLRLFACACCRRLWCELSLEDQAIVSLIEQCAESQAQLETVRRRLHELCPNSLFQDWDQSDWGWLRRGVPRQSPEWPTDEELKELEMEGGWFPEILFLPNPRCATRITLTHLYLLRAEAEKRSEAPLRRPLVIPGKIVEDWGESWDDLMHAVREDESPWQANILRDIVNNPFRPTPAVNRSWQIWRDGTVVRLAQSIYEEMAFHRMPMLAHAIEEAGCANSEILNHCRGQGQHVRGCWLLDLVLAKE